MKCTWKTKGLYISPNGYEYSRTCCECVLCCAVVCYAMCNVQILILLTKSYMYF